MIRNIWISYRSRSYYQIKTDIINSITNPSTGIPEITDHSESNPFIKLISIWSGIADQIGYYLDNQARETFVFTVRIYASMIKLTRQYDYRVRSAIPASGEVKFYLSAPATALVTIPSNTVIKYNDIEYRTIDNATIDIGDSFVYVQVEQKTLVPWSTIGISNGLPNQGFILYGNVADKTVSVRVDSTTYYYHTDSFALDTPSTNTFYQIQNENEQTRIEFGDGVNGSIPLNTKTIEVSYFTTLGSGGNIGSGLINEISTVLTLPPSHTLNVINETSINNGTDPEDIKALRKMIPIALRTKYRAVTKRDYKDVTETAPGVAKAQTDYSCGKKVPIYIAPNGGGIASLTLRNNTLAFMNERKMITTELDVFSAGEVFIQYNIDVFAKSGYVNSDVKANVENALIEFHSIENQDISGTVNIGDIYQVVEETDGVSHCVITIMTPVPYARPLNTTSPALTWNRTLLATSSLATYRILFQTSTTYLLFRNEVFQSINTTGVAITTVDLTFTILGSYVAGDTWDWKTYNANGTVSLQEMSLPKTNIGSLNINVTGGL